MALGTVKIWSRSRGSGWIRPDSGGDLLYVHKSGITKDATDTAAASLEQGIRVEYSVGQRPKGPAALNVRPSTEAPAADSVEGAARAKAAR